MTIEERLKLYKRTQSDLEIYNYLKGVLYRAKEAKDMGTYNKYKKEMEKYRLRAYRKHLIGPNSKSKKRK